MTRNEDRYRNRRLLIVTDNEITAKRVGDAFAAQAYEVLATINISEAIRFMTTRKPDPILLMLSSLAKTCEVIRQIKPCTSATIIGFSPTPVTATERNAALQSGCDRYRDAFSRN